MDAYCFKCREKREMKDAHAVTMKNGKPATEGVCPVCGTKMFKIGSGTGDTKAKAASGDGSQAKSGGRSRSAAKT